jgi:hypothetical protein
MIRDTCNSVAREESPVVLPDLLDLVTCAGDANSDY